jgi:hypothetical protein
MILRNRGLAATAHMGTSITTTGMEGPVHICYIRFRLRSHSLYYIQYVYVKAIVVIFTYTYIFIYIYIYLFIYIYTYIYIHIHIYTYHQARFLGKPNVSVSSTKAIFILAEIEDETPERGNPGGPVAIAFVFGASVTASKIRNY